MVNSRKILMAFCLPEALRDVLDGIARFAKQHARNWQVLCVEANEFERNLAHHGADGAITALRPRDVQLIRRLQRCGTPAVNLLHNLHPRLPSVLSDDQAIGKVGATYLLGRGFRSLAFLGVNTSWSQARQTGFIDTARDAGVESVSAIKPLPVTDFQFVSKVRAVATLRQWVRGFSSPMAVMAACDFAGRALVEAALAEGLRVPENLAVLGADNFHALCELSPVASRNHASNCASGFAASPARSSASRR